MKDYKKLKMIIQEANPEIMKLKFGCEVEWGYEHSLNSISKVWRIKKGKFINFFDWQGNYLMINFPGNKTNSKLLKEDIKIIGRLIRLADVLLAIEEKTNGYDKIDGYLVNTIGDIARLKYKNSCLNKLSNTVNWNLKDDNLDNQSKQTKQFLIDILVN